MIFGKSQYITNLCFIVYIPVRYQIYGEDVNLSSVGGSGGILKEPVSRLLQTGDKV